MISIKEIGKGFGGLGLETVARLSGTGKVVGEGFPIRVSFLAVTVDLSISKRI